METGSIIMLILGLAILYGGLTTFISIAMRSEKSKSKGT